jgi:hypothetical protein
MDIEGTEMEGNAKMSCDGESLSPDDGDVVDGECGEEIRRGLVADDEEEEVRVLVLPENVDGAVMVGTMTK